MGFDLDFEHVTGKQPKTVAIVALGPTTAAWHATQWNYTPMYQIDEVWSLNKASRTVKADLYFVMDDLVGEARRSLQYAKDLNALTVPVITSIVDQPVRDLYPDVALTEYPINEVALYYGARHLLARGMSESVLKLKPFAIRQAADAIGMYLHNSIPYMLAYAGFIGVKEIHVYGADYTYPGLPAREKDRGCAEYWGGVLRGLGVEVHVPRETTLFNTRDGKWLYGYGARMPEVWVPDADDVPGLLARCNR